jgi:hypothetical protein
MAEYKTPAEIAQAYIEDTEIRAALEDHIIEWYNWKIVGIKAAFKSVIAMMGSPTIEVLYDAIDNLEILEEEES